MAPTPPTTAQAPDPREVVQQLIRGIQRNLVRVVFTTLVFLMVGAFLSMLWPSKYSASTTFVLREQRIVTDTTVIEDLARTSMVKKLAALEAEVKSPKRIETVMNELGWKEWLETAGREGKRRDLYTKVKSNLDVSMNPDVQGGINVVFDFQWTDPRKTADFVNRLRDSWMKGVLESFRRNLEAQKEELERVVLDRERDYQAALQALHKYERENDVPSLLDVETNTSMKAQFHVRLSEAKAGLESNVTKIGVLRSELLAIPREVEVPDAPEDPEVMAALKVFQHAEDAFEDAREKYTDLHPTYIATKKAMQSAKKDLADLGGEPQIGTRLDTNPDYYDKAQELAAVEEREREFRALVNQLEDELQRVDHNLQALPRVLMDKRALDQNVETLSGLLTQSRIAVQPLRDRVRSVRDAQTAVGASAAGLVGSGPFEILETAIEPESPVLPMGAILMVVFLLLGVAAGLSGPIVGQFTRTSFGSVKEVSRTLGVPVLGTVDLILTTRDVRARTVQSALTITTMVLVLMALGTALYIYANHPDVLPAELVRTLRDMQMALT